MKTRSSPILILLAFICLAVAAPTPKAFGILPTPDGCYPNYTTAEGCRALQSLTSGLGNTAIGWYSLFGDTTASFNTGIGAGALVLNIADNNTATGAGALLLNTSGADNTAVGTDALVYNDTGSENTAIGAFALFSNTIGIDNSALGKRALNANTEGSFNTAVGENALSGNVNGTFNTASGFNTLGDNTAGTHNTANGHVALRLNTTGSDNTAVGESALFHNTTGGQNTALGENAGFSQTTGSGNVYIGLDAPGVAGESNHTYISNINTTSVSGGGTDTVTVNLMTGLLGHATSSRRYKEDIKPMDKASEALYRLNPVTYRYKKEMDPTQSLAFGLVAEEVAHVNSGLVAHNAKGEPEAVHYEMINAMLLNEFLKEHRKVEQQQAAIAELKSVVAQQQNEFRAAMSEQRKEMENVISRLEQQAAQIRSVQRLDTARRLQSAQIEMSKVALGRIRRGGTVPQTVANNP